MLFWKKKTNNDGLTKEELQREITYLENLAKHPDSIKDKHVIEMTTVALNNYKRGLTNFDDLDINKDGKLDASETKNK